MKRNIFKKATGYMLILMMFLSISISQTSFASAEEAKIEEIGLVVTGTNVGEDIYLTKTDLEEIAAGKNTDYQLVDILYSIYEDHGKPDRALTLTRGIDVNSILKKADIKGEHQIKTTFISTDGAYEELSYNAENKLLDGGYYYYPNILSDATEERAEGAIEVMPILAFYKVDSRTGEPSKEDLKKVTDSEKNPTIYPTLVRGQENIEDHNRCKSIKTVQKIIVGNSEAKFFTIKNDENIDKSYNMMDLFLKGIETKTYDGKTCEGISIERLLKDAEIILEDLNSEQAVKVNIKDSEDIDLSAEEIKDNQYLLTYKVDKEATKKDSTLQIYRNGKEPILDVQGITIGVKDAEPVEPQYEFNIKNIEKNTANGIAVTANIEQLEEATSATVVFQLMKGNTPISIIALDKGNLLQNEKITAYFPVQSGNYDVNILVLDQFTSDTSKVEKSLGKPVKISNIDIR